MPSRDPDLASGKQAGLDAGGELDVLLVREELALVHVVKAEPDQRVRVQAVVFNWIAAGLAPAESAVVNTVQCRIHLRQEVDEHGGGEASRGDGQLTAALLQLGA